MNKVKPPVQLKFVPWGEVAIKQIFMENAINKVTNGVKDAQEQSKLPSERYAEELAKEKATKNPYAEGSRYYDLYNRNPYTMQNFHARETAWDHLASGLGFKSGYEAQLEDWLRARDEYNAQVEQLKGEDEYSSEKAKAQRMREAGINPDLQGIGEASNAAEFAMEATGPQIRSNNESAERIIGVISDIPKAITFAMGMTQDITKTMGLIYDNETKRISNGQKMMDLAEDFVKNFMNEENKSETGGRLEFNVAAQNIEEEAALWARNNGFKQEHANKFGSSVAKVFRGKKDEWYNLRTKTNEARKNYGLSENSEYTTNKDDEQEILATTGTLAKTMDDILVNEAEGRAEKAKTEKEYWTNKSGTQEAAAENARNKQETSKENMVTQGRNAIQQIIDKLDKYAKKGNILAIGLQSALAIVQMRLIEGSNISVGGSLVKKLK